MNIVLAYLESADALLGSLPTRERIARSPKLQDHRTFKVRVDRTMTLEVINNVMTPL